MPVRPPLASLIRTVRPLARTPVFTATIVLILGIAIGMSTAMFTVFDAVLLRPLPVADADAVVTLLGVGRGAAAEVPVSIDQLGRYRNETAAFSGVAGYAHWGAYPFAIRDGDRPLVLRQAAVTGNFFDVLGASPVLGRMLEADDDRPWAPADENTGDFNIVLSHAAWQRVFGGDPDVIGHRLSMPTNHWDPVIVGVAPPGLDFPRGVDYWIPANYNGLDLVARLRPGATLAAAQRDYQNFIDQDPDYAQLGENTLIAEASPLATATVGDVRPALLALTAAVGLLLVLACVNIAGVVLVRASGRWHEVAIRRALGAGTGRIAAGLFAETALLAIASGLTGFVVGRIFLDLLLRLAPDALPRADIIGTAGTPFMIAGGVTLVVLIAVGLAPAVGTTRLDLSSSLRAGGRGGTEGRGLRRLRHAMVAAQMALALVVLAGAGLLLRSFAELAGLNPGFTREHLSMLSVAPPYDRYVRACTAAAPADELNACVQESMFALHERIEARLATVPDVANATTLMVQPFLGPSVFMTKVAAEGQSLDTGSDNPWFGFDAVGVDFFETFRIPVLRGRGFMPADYDGGPGIAVVSEGVAHALWPGEDAVGRRFGGLGITDPDSLITVIGIVPDVHYREHRVATPTIYRPYTQVGVQGMFAVRTRGTLAAALPGIEAALGEVEPALVITQAETMDDLTVPQLAGARLQALLLAAFALAAVGIAAIGLYGIMAQAVARRRRELGVRMALGSTGAQLRRMVLRQATMITVAGGLVGLAGALAASRVIAALLFRVSPLDPLTLGGVTLLLLAVGLAAAYVPAARATGADPLEALRAE